MYRPNFCAECGARIVGQRRWASRQFCPDCAPRFRKAELGKPLAAIATIAIAAFVVGRYLRPAPPPLVIQRSANSPLADAPVKTSGDLRPGQTQSELPPAVANQPVISGEDNQAAPASTTTANDVVYICGARTKKGTPCHRRVHAPGERCYQHKGMPAMLPPEKLIVKG